MPVSSHPKTLIANCAISGTFKFLPGFMTCLIQWGHKPSKNSKSVENHIFRGHAAPVASASASWLRWLHAGWRDFQIAARCTCFGTFKFLPGFMTCLIQWGHKPSKNSKSIENHIFRGPPSSSRAAGESLGRVILLGPEILWAER